MSDPALATDSAPARRAADNLRGMAWALGAGVGIAIMASVIKEATQEMKPTIIVFFRMLFLFAIWLPWGLRRHMAGFRTKRLGLHLFRAVTGLGAFSCLTFAVTYLLLADATALAFAQPLWMIPISFLVLGEVVGWRRGAATVAGFAGVLLIVKPGGAMHPAMLAAVAAAIFGCLTMLAVKKLMRTERPGTIILYFGLTGAVLSAVPAWLTWETPSWYGLSLIVLASLAASFGQYCNARAFGLGDATVVAPVGYSRLVFGAVIGLVVFGEVPDNFSIGGIAVVLTATIAISVLEARARARAARQ